jgi:hypothetical protein
MRTGFALLLSLPWAPCLRAQVFSAPVEARIQAPAMVLSAPIVLVPAALAPMSAPPLSAAPAFSASLAAPVAGPALLAAPAAASGVAIPALAAALPSIAAAPSRQAPSEAASGEKPAAQLDALFDGEGVRRIRFVSGAGDSAEGLASARAYLHALARQPSLGSPRESAAVTRLKPLFHLRTHHEAVLDPGNPGSLVIRQTGRLPKFGDYRYVDLTNGSRFATTDSKGGVHHFVAVRALREGYTVRVDLKSGSPATELYVSDQLLFEVKYDARGNVTKRKFVEPLVLSTSDDILAAPGKFVFEDGRVYSPAPGKLVVSGTVIADFLNQPRTLSYRNGLAELEVDPVTGIPRVKRDPVTGDPAWHYLTPVGADFKNGMVLSTGRGSQVVALFRLYSAEAQGVLPAGYSLIRFSFPSYDDFLKYDSVHLLEDVLHPSALAALSRPHPGQSGVLLAAADLQDLYANDPRVTKSGFGPGSKPARLSMGSNGDVFLEESLGARLVKIGHVPARERAGFPLQAGDSKWLFLGHELRAYRDGFNFRDYNAFAWLTDETMSKVERVRGALMVGDSSFESGESSLITDLARHNYPMGAEVMENGEYHFSYGASDKHTGAAKLDVMALLRELADGSSATREGLSYKPGTRGR